MSVFDKNTRRVLSYDVLRKKIAVFTYRYPHFCFPMETPLRLSRNMLHGWKDNSMLAKRLAVCTYLSSIVFKLYDA